jgi:hypothetical protein
MLLILVLAIVTSNPYSSAWQDSNWGFIFKVIVLSALISVAIKVAGPFISLPATPAVALTLVLSPTVLMSLILFWRTQRQRR